MKKFVLFAVATTALTGANILAGVRLWIGPVSITWGIVLIPILLIIGDSVHECYGYKASRRITHTAIAACVVIYAVLHITGIQPTAWIVAVRIILGSMIACELADLTNDKVFRYIQQREPEAMQKRHILSSAPALFVDSIVFQIFRNAPVPSFLPFAEEANRWSFDWLSVVATFTVVSVLRIGVEFLAWPLTEKIIKVCKEQ